MNIFGLFKRKEKPVVKTSYVLKAKEDITAYELSKLVWLMIPRPYRNRESFEKEIDKLPDDCKRHIEKVEKTET